MAKERYLFIDVARGMAMLLVVFGHCCVPADIFVNQVLLSFHMPLFFFMSGIFFKGPQIGCYGDYTLMRIKKLMAPHLTMAVITAICSVAIVRGIKHEPIELETYTIPFLYWFLPVLMICLLLMILAFAVAREKRKASILAILVSLVLIYPSILATDYVDNNVSNALLQSALRILYITPTALLFFALGSYMKDLVINHFAHYEISVKRGFINILLLCAFIVLAERNGYVFMYTNHYGFNYVAFFVCAAIGIYCSLLISTFLQKSRILQFAGEFSICLYVWNFVVCGNTARVANLLNKYIEINPTALSVISFMIAFVIIMTLTKLTKGKFGYLYGL